jgi:hypothetical protein
MSFSGSNPTQDRGSTSLGGTTDSILIQHLKSFLHLTTQAPLEYVCTSALYLLNHVPSTRHAVLEYIGTFYKVATFLHLQYNRSQNQQKQSSISSPDQIAEANNINHINQVIDLIENSLIEILTNKKNNEIWSLELSKWLIDILGEIVSNSSEAFANTPGLTNEEINALRTPSIVDGLEIWSNQCKPTQSLLLLIQKCFTLADKPSTHSRIIDSLIECNFKYELKFDWVPCYFSALNPQLIFESFLKFSIKESLKASNKSPKVNVMNFFSQNFSSLVRNELEKLIQQKSYDNVNNIEKKVIISFFLRMAAQSSALAVLIIDEMLNSANKDTSMYDDDFEPETDLLSYFVTYFAYENIDSTITNDLFGFLKQINNSVAIFDLISNLLEWFTSKNDCFELHEKQGFIKTIQSLMVIKIEPNFSTLKSKKGTFLPSSELYLSQIKLFLSKKDLF